MASWDMVEEFIYKYYLDKDTELNGHLVQVDYSSPSALWFTLHQRYQPYYLYNVLYLILVSWYFIVSFFFVVIEKMGWFHSYKINPKATTWEDYKSCFQNLALNFLIVIPTMNTLGWPVFKSIGLHWHNEFPTLTTFLLHIAACYVLEDFGHYVLHRTLHIKALYPLIHKVHHEYIAPFALSATQAHPIETAILGLATFYPAIVLKDFHLFTLYVDNFCLPSKPFHVWFYAKQKPSHVSWFCAKQMSLSFGFARSFTLMFLDSFSFSYVWIVLRSYDANIEHCGYDLSRDFHWIPFYGGTAFHDKHHTSFNYNFASRFTYLDKLFGTYKESDTPAPVQKKKKAN